MAKWLGRWTPDQAVRARALAGALRCVTLTETLSNQVYKLVLVNLLLEGTLQWTSFSSRGGGGGRNTPSHFKLRKQDKLRPNGPTGLYADSTYYFNKTIYSGGTGKS